MTNIKCPNPECDGELYYFQHLAYKCPKCKKEYKVNIIKSELVEVNDKISKEFEND